MCRLYADDKEDGVKHRITFVITSTLGRNWTETFDLMRLYFESLWKVQELFVLTHSLEVQNYMQTTCRWQKKWSQISNDFCYNKYLGEKLNRRIFLNEAESLWKVQELFVLIDSLEVQNYMYKIKRWSETSNDFCFKKCLGQKLNRDICLDDAALWTLKKSSRTVRVNS